MTTDIRNFHTDLKIGELAEQELKRILLKNRFTTSVDKVDHISNGYDLHLKYCIGEHIEELRIEVKTLKGCVQTGVIEQWADNARTKRPHWMNMGDTDRIYFQNRKENMWYAYNAKEVAEWIKAQPESTIRANNDCKDDSGWLLMFYWDSSKYSSHNYNKKFDMPGFIKKFKGECK